ncbi:hypothetical protein [Mycobacterium sp. E1386]|uniref:hypothetical protein n=1 Tax=Mycobacterium sp. E1386 TaxID=1834126 RepID=UPI0012EAD5F3|nr:hypothetical protein [Mycobacterium sp. E1386]
MPRPKRQPGQQGAGLYQTVREAVEEDAARHTERIAAWPVDPEDQPYELQRILDALRRDETTDVPAWAIPKAARGDACMARGRDTGDAREATCFYVAIVRPDDTVTFAPDDGSKMIDYLGI